MDAVTPKPTSPADLRSHHVRVGEMEWQKTRFPGCEVKTLLFDRDCGRVTALMRFAPGAVLPDDEHVKIEQTYVLEGKLVDREGPDAGLTVPEGDFVWHPRRHRSPRRLSWAKAPGHTRGPQGGEGMWPRVHFRELLEGRPSRRRFCGRGETPGCTPPGMKT